MTQQQPTDNAPSREQRLQQIRARVDAVEHDSDYAFMQDITRSEAALLDSAPADIRFLLEELDQRDQANARLRDQLAAATGALEGIDGVTRLFIDDFEKHITPTSIVVRVSDYIRKWKQTATPPAGAANEDGER